MKTDGLTKMKALHLVLCYITFGTIFFSSEIQKMASKLFQSAQHLRLARSKRSSKAGVEARSILNVVKSVKVKQTITTTVEIDNCTPSKQVSKKQKEKIEAERLKPLTTALKASLELAIESKRKFEKGTQFSQNYLSFHLKKKNLIFPDEQELSPPSPPRKNKRTQESKVGAALVGHRRGSFAEIAVQGSYGAGKTYGFDDVCRICGEVESGTIKLAWLYQDNKNHNPDTMNVPRSTIVRWLQPDIKVVGERGAPDIAHWRAERDIRRRTTLNKAGGFRGTGLPMFGAGEKAIQVYVSYRS